jgi:hypothetical protein
MIRAITILGALVVAMGAYASESEELFLRANREYQEHHYEKALELYTMITEKGSATWHNMGNCACNLKQPLDALVYWRKAQRGCRLSEFDELQKNIDGMYSQLQKTPTRGPWAQFLDKYIHRFSLLFFQIFFLLVWCLLFVVMWLNHRYKKGLIFILVPLILLSGTGMVTKHRSQTCPCALVVQENATLFAGPDTGHRVVGTVEKAHELVVVDRRGDWCKVRTQNLAGWVLADTLKTL